MSHEVDQYVDPVSLNLIRQQLISETIRYPPVVRRISKAMSNMVFDSAVKIAGDRAALLVHSIEKRKYQVCDRVEPKVGRQETDSQWGADGRRRCLWQQWG